jgi:hypothetical protein
MAAALAGRRIVISPLSGESEFMEELYGEIEGVVRRPGFRQDLVYYLVRLQPTLNYWHPELKRNLKIEKVLVWPDSTMLEWAFYGGGPPGLPVLIKVFAIISRPDSETDYVRGEIFPLARAAAKAWSE